jgi:hypothetical protein
MFQRLIDQYLLAFPDERERLLPLNQLLSSATNLDVVSRNHKVGHLTASGFVVSPSHDQLLLIQHKKLQRLLQPGGHMEPTDASPLDAASSLPTRTKSRASPGIHSAKH